MQTAKIFENGRSQAVRLPKRYRFEGDEVLVQRVGEALILVPESAAWETFLAGLNAFTEDFLAGGREPERSTVRDVL